MTATATPCSLVPMFQFCRGWPRNRMNSKTADDNGLILRPPNARFGSPKLGECTSESTKGLKRLVQQLERNPRNDRSFHLNKASLTVRRGRWTKIKDFELEIFFPQCSFLYISFSAPRPASASVACNHCVPASQSFEYTPFI